MEYTGAAISMKALLAIEAKTGPSMAATGSAGAVDTAVACRSSWCGSTNVSDESIKSVFRSATGMASGTATGWGCLWNYPWDHKNHHWCSGPKESTDVGCRYAPGIHHASLSQSGLYRCASVILSKITSSILDR